MPHKLITRIRLLWRKRFGVLPLGESLDPLSDWFNTPMGRRLVALEQEYIDEYLHNVFGYHLLQLSIAGQLNLTQSSRILHRFALYPKASASPFIKGLTHFNHLPLPPNSIDLVLLHHVLDYSQSPHQLLREAANVLISQGHIILVGFNPFSLLGLWRWLLRWLSRAPHWRHQSLRLGRVLDWLRVLDCEPLVVRQGFFVPLGQNPQALKYLSWLERWGKRLCLPWGGFYVIVARKDSVTLTPLKPQWQGYGVLRGWGVVKILGRVSKEPEAPSTTR